MEHPAWKTHFDKKHTKKRKHNVNVEIQRIAPVTKIWGFRDNSASYFPVNVVVNKPHLILSHINHMMYFFSTYDQYT